MAIKLELISHFLDREVTENVKLSVAQGVEFALNYAYLSFYKWNKEQQKIVVNRK